MADGDVLRQEVREQPETFVRLGAAPARSDAERLLRTQRTAEELIDGVVGLATAWSLATARGVNPARLPWLAKVTLAP